MDQDEIRTGPSPHGWVRRVVAQRRSVLVCTFIGWLIVVSAGWVLPSKYRSETLILVEQQKVPEHYVEPNIAVDLQQRLQSMSEQILSRTRLMAIADKLHLYRGNDSRAGAEGVVDRMRKDISIDLVRSTNEQISAFKVSYSANSPEVAQQVTSELTSLFIEENLQNRQELSENTTDFLETQLDVARKNLEQQEMRLREFKSRYLGQLPEQTPSNMQILAGLQNRLQSASDSLNQAEQQKLYLQSLLGQYHASRQASSADQGKLVANSVPSATAQKLQQLRSQLADLRSKYTSRHPDVVRLEEEIADTEKAQASQAVNEGDAATGGAALNSDQAPAAGPILQIESQLKATDFEIASRKDEIKKIEADIDSYQQKLNLAPAREQELAAITRDHEQSTANYESLLAKKNQSEMATNLEKRQQGEQFRMIDPPSLPQRPYFPNRLLFSACGIAFGLTLGAGSAILRELVNAKVYGEEELQSIVKAPSLVLVPSVLTTSETSARNRSLLLDGAIAAVIALTIPATTLFLYYKA